MSVGLAYFNYWLIGCSPKLLSMLTAFHSNTKSTVRCDGAVSNAFIIKSGVKQGCVLAPTLFEIFFSLVLSHAFRTSEDGIYIHTRSDSKFFNLARLKAKSKIRKVLIRGIIFADDAALTSHSAESLQRLIDKFADACKEFGLTISIKKTNIMGQDVHNAPSININEHILDTVQDFTYLGSTITSNLSTDVKIGKASSAMSRLTNRVRENGALTENTRFQVYKACVLSVLLYGGETWTIYAKQELRLNTFLLRCLGRILGITWQDHIPNTEVLKRRLRWLGHPLQ